MNMTHPNILQAEGQGMPDEPQPEQTYTCFLCKEDYECLEPIEIGGQHICPECLELDKKTIIEYLVECLEKIERLES